MAEEHARHSRAGDSSLILEGPSVRPPSSPMLPSILVSAGHFIVVLRLSPSSTLRPSFFFSGYIAHQSLLPLPPSILPRHRLATCAVLSCYIPRNSFRSHFCLGGIPFDPLSCVVVLPGDPSCVPPPLAPAPASTLWLFFAGVASRWCHVITVAAFARSASTPSFRRLMRRPESPFRTLSFRLYAHRTRYSAACTPPAIQCPRSGSTMTSMGTGPDAIPSASLARESPLPGMLPTFLAGALDDTNSGSGSRTRGGFPFATRFLCPARALSLRLSASPPRSFDASVTVVLVPALFCGTSPASLALPTSTASTTPLLPRLFIPYY
ncbi:hypothetical protein B0H14DRAFT_3888950 [Mycena olivaceomarginata]|nr:hypothetical protein B0H14DRAFT_3888950 [Mycena olivaceomarginata]